MLQDLRNKPVGGHSVGLGLELQEDPVPQRRLGDSAQVIEGDVVPSLEERPYLGGEHQGLAAHSVELRPIGMGRADQASPIEEHMLRDRHLAGDPLRGKDRFRVGDGV